MKSNRKSQQRLLLAHLLSNNPVYRHCNEESLTNATEDILQESFYLLDVSGREDDAALIVHYDFYKKEITGGNPFMFWEICQ